jgi:hypothetical protein
MFIYATATGVFFALLWKNTRRDRIIFFLKVFVGLFIGGIALAWAMYPFPLR